MYSEYQKMLFKCMSQIDEACFKKQNILTLTFPYSKVPIELVRYCQIVEKKCDILYNESTNVGKLVILTTPQTNLV